MDFPGNRAGGARKKFCLGPPKSTLLHESHLLSITAEHLQISLAICSPFLCYFLPSMLCVPAPCVGLLCHVMIAAPLYTKNYKQWLKARGTFDKWKPKVVFQCKAQTCMCPICNMHWCLSSLRLLSISHAISCPSHRGACSPSLTNVPSFTTGY